MAYSAAKFIENLTAVRSNPMEIQRVQLEALEAAMEGKIDLVDATNPLVFLLEANAMTGAGNQVWIESGMRQLYPELAAVQEDLYRHMTDVDYLGRFSLPSSTTVTIALNWDELKTKVLPIPDSDVKKLVIPRNTQFSINGVNFGMQYPIEIRLMPHGDFQVVYLNDKPSPLWNLKSNLVAWEKIRTNASGTFQTWMYLTIAVKQFNVTSTTQPTSSTTTYNKVFNLGDNYYYCRVYGMNADGVTWTEYMTTHSDQVYDAKKVTAKLKVNGSQLQVYIPEIYYSSNLVGAQIRVDIYTTKGPLSINLTEYSTSEWSATWQDFDDVDNGKYFAPLGNNLSMSIWSDTKTTGGTEPISFETLREQVIMNNTYVNTPITGQQLDTAQQINGFSIVKAKDVITKRTYAGSKALPAPSSGSLETGAGALISMLETNMVDLATRSTVVDNDTSITVKPTTLFNLNAGVLSVVSEAEYQMLQGYMTAKNWDDLLVSVENRTGQLVYTPFHYVMDTVNNSFDLRAYYLDTPAVVSRSFIDENSTAQLLVGTDAIDLTRTETGYLLRASVKSGASYKALADSQCHAQLMFVPAGEDDYAVVTGTIVSTLNGERVWEFVLDTTFYVNGSDQIQLSGVSMYEGNLINALAELSQQFYLLYEVSDYTDVNDIKETDLDLLVYKPQVPASTIGITQESLTLSFGTSLTWLWRKSRTVKDSVVYETYDEDVPALWEATEYKKDPATGQKVLTLNEATGKYDLVILHNVGDPVLDANGNPTLKYEKGTVKTVNGVPIVAGPRAVVRHVDLFLVDGRFYFATEANDVTYRAELAEAVVDYLVDIADINDRLLENTELYYVPVTTLGESVVLVGAGLETSISSTQSFQVSVYMSKVNYNNESLKASLTAKIKTIIHQALTEATFSVDGLASLIGASLGDDVMAIDVSPIGTNRDLSVFTAVDDITRCSVKRKLVVLPEDVLQVQDDIEVDYIRHQRVQDLSSAG